MEELEWHPATSSRITHEAYDAELERICVRFHDGTQWEYRACPPDVWRRFTAPGQSRGKFINEELDRRPQGPFTG